MTDKTKFGYYVAAFIDLLGQKEALKNLQRLPNTENAQEMQAFTTTIRDTFGLLHDFHNSFTKFFTGYSNREESFTLTQEQRKIYDQMGSNEVNLQRFSDGLLLSLSLRDDKNKGHMLGVSGILYSCGAMFIVWLSQGHPMRAGIDIGVAAELYEKEIYGSALTNAYILENEVAQYPRIVIGDELIRYFNFVKKLPDDNIFNKANKAMVAEAERMIAIDHDGRPIVDYLGEVFKARFDSVEMTDAVFDAYKFVVEQSNRWKAERNSKLAFRYAALREYFDARLSIWGNESSKSRVNGS